MMNLKYYLRGLGIGVIVTALIMGITAGGKKETLSDEEIRERAQALGMVEESTLLMDIGTQEPDQETQSGEAQEPEEKQEPSEIEGKDALVLTPEDVKGEEEGSPEPKDGEMAENTDTSQPESPDDTVAESPAPSVKKEPGPDAPVGEGSDLTAPVEGEPEQDGDLIKPENGSQAGTGNVAIQIARGDGSYTVSKKLEEAGLVESASDYDTFLYQNGYDKKIRAGSFEIPAGAGRDQIARIICGME